jgi:PII-like signaling protein
MASSIGDNMNSVYLKFYIAEKQRHNGTLLYEWLLEEAKRLGASGGTAFRSIAGFGRHGKMHEETFFELAGELPVQVEFVLDAVLADKFLDDLRGYKLNLYFVRYAVDAGVI